MTGLQGVTDDEVRCSFCGKKQRQVKKLVAGRGVYICNECIDLCNDVIIEEMPEPPPLAVQLDGLSKRLSEVGTILHEVSTEVGQLAKRVGLLAQRSEDLDSGTPPLGTTGPQNL